METVDGCEDAVGREAEEMVDATVADLDGLVGDGVGEGADLDNGIVAA